MRASTESPKAKMLTRRQDDPTSRMAAIIQIQLRHPYSALRDFTYKCSDLRCAFGLIIPGTLFGPDRGLPSKTRRDDDQNTDRDTPPAAGPLCRDRRGG